MKKLLFIAIAIVLLSACTKDITTKPQCPVLSADNVLVAVKESFKTTYPASTADTWYNKDDKAYVASFMDGNSKKLAYFGNSGTLLKTEIDDDNDGDYDVDEEVELEEGDDNDLQEELENEEGCQCGDQDDDDIEDENEQEGEHEG